jgi:MoaA/NifB/PqqE/SkfB family radical SAM enzyme
MSSILASWKFSKIRNKMADYRRAQEDYYLQGKPMVELENGQKAFSLLTPPLGSRVARRRVRLIMDNMRKGKSMKSGAVSTVGSGRTPHVITVAVTYNCQCDCLHCSASKVQEEVQRAHSGLRYEELCGAIGQAVDLGATCVVLTGGEPLLYDKIYDVIQSVDKTRSICTIFSNGEFLTEQTAEKLKQAGIFGVFVSFDHPTAESHNENRKRPGLFEKALRGLECCQRAGIPVGISTYATKQNIQDGGLDAMMDLARQRKVLEVFLFDVIPTGRLSDQRDCVLSDQEVNAVRMFRSKYNGKPDYPRIIHQTMFSSIAYPCVAEGCPAGLATVHLRANGDVCPCDFTPHSFGNVRRQPLQEIWHSMISSDLYAEPSVRCRLSQPAFWDKLEQLPPTP